MAAGAMNDARSAAARQPGEDLRILLIQLVHVGEQPAAVDRAALPQKRERRLAARNRSIGRWSEFMNS